MGLISAQQVYDEPLKWLDVLHEVHESLLGFMALAFPDFQARLEGRGIHCLLCEGKETPVVYVLATWERKRVTGYVEKPEVLLHLVDP